MGAAFLKCEELELEESESKRLADAVTRVSDLYDLGVISEKALAWTNLVTCMGGVYGPRFMAISLKKKKAKNKVVDMQPIAVV